MATRQRQVVSASRLALHGPMTSHQAQPHREREREREEKNERAKQIFSNDTKRQTDSETAKAKANFYLSVHSSDTQPVKSAQQNPANQSTANQTPVEPESREAISKQATGHDHDPCFTLLLPSLYYHLPTCRSISQNGTLIGTSEQSIAHLPNVVMLQREQANARTWSVDFQLRSFRLSAAAVLPAT